MSSEQKSEILARLDRARNDRRRVEAQYNEILLYTWPDRQRMGRKTQLTDNRSFGQLYGEIYDQTMMQAAEDYVAYRSDEQTPYLDPWARFEPAIELNEVERAQIQPAIEMFEAYVYEMVRRTNFYDIEALVRGERGITAGGIEILPDKQGVPVCHFVPASELLIENHVAGGVGARWRERCLMAEMLPDVFPDAGGDKREERIAFWKNALGRDKLDASPIDVICGYRPNYAKIDENEWTYEIICSAAQKDRVKTHPVVYSRTVSGPGCVGLLVNRARPTAPSAWGMGEFALALPLARALDDMQLHKMTIMANRADPAIFYADDGETNYADGFESGARVRVGDNFNWHIAESKHDLSELFFDIAEKQHLLRRALFVDEPEPVSGKGSVMHRPLGQWFDEKASLARRIDPWRNADYFGYVMPVIQRFQRLLADAGGMPKVELNGRAVVLRPRSPLSNARDLDRASNYFNFDQAMTQSVGPEEANILMDKGTTWREVAKLLGLGEVAKFRSAEDVAAERERIAQMNAMQDAAGQIAGAAIAQ